MVLFVLIKWKAESAYECTNKVNCNISKKMIESIRVHIRVLNWDRDSSSYSIQ